MKPALRPRVAVSAARTCSGGVDDRDGDADVLGEPRLGARGAAGPDGLDGQAVTQHGVVADLLELGIRQPQARGGAQVEGLAPADLDVDALVAPFHEGGELVDGEVVLDPVAQLLGDVAGVVGERLGRVGRPPAAVPVLEGQAIENR
jgi:hypothetical protein